jgi:rfaE bifunctional protein kinase chain/domain
MIDPVHAITSIFSEKKVVIIGDVVADQFLHGSISRVSREAPVFILRHEETETRPGGAANAAANVASLGARPLLIGVTGNDENRVLLRGSLNDHNVSCEYIIEDFCRTTTTKVRVLAGQPYSVKQQVIRIDYEGSAELSDEIESRLIEHLRLAAKQADAIVVSDYGYGVVSPDIFDEARELATKRDIPLVVDSRFRLSELSGATSATPNQAEVEQLLGKGFTDDDCARLCNDLGFKSLMVTCGNQGMIVIEPGREAFRIHAVGSAQPVDVTGAGDTVIAAYALGLAAGLSVRKAAAVSNHAGGIVVMKKGTATVSKSELLKSVANESVLLRSDFAA